MAANTVSKTYDALLTTTADKIHKSGAVQDAISNSNPTFKELNDKGRIKKKVVGGDQIRVGLMYELNKPASYSGYDQIDISPKDGMTTIFLPWAQYAGAVTIDGLSRFKNMGKEKIADLLKEKVKQLTAGYAEKMNADLWEVDNLTAVHPYTANSGKNMIGIPLYVQPHTTSSIASEFTSRDIGVIDQSAETWWHNQIFDAGNSLTAAGLKKLLSNAMNTCGQGPYGAPDLLIADQVSYELYEQSMQDQIRYSYNDKASAGFESLSFKNAKIMWDGYVPDTETSGTNNGALATGSALTKGSIFLINTNTMCLYVGKDHDFKPRGFQTPVDQDASTSLYLTYIQLVCDNRRKNGVVFDVPVALS